MNTKKLIRSKLPKRRRVSHPMHYPAVMDWWVASGAFLLIAGLIALLPGVLWSSLPRWQSGLVALVIAIMLLFIIDTAFFTSYWLTEQGLLVSSQLKQSFFAYRSMRSIESCGVRGLLTFGWRKRFGLSANGYDIRLENSPWQVISVSPRDQDRFIHTMLTRIDAERSKRATVDA